MSGVVLSAKCAARRPWSAFCVLGMLAVWLIFLACLRPLTLPDEGRYAGVAWEMLRSQSPLVPLLDGMPYFHKPPLYYWLAQLSFAVFGLSEWAARLPSLLTAWLAVLGVFVFMRHHRSEQSAIGAALILSTMPFFYGAAQFANLDMTVASMITLSTLAGAQAILCGAHARPWRLMSLSCAAFAALAVLAKGLIGIVLPGAVLGVWLLIRRDIKGVKILLWPAAIGLFFALAAPWFIVMQLRYPGFFDYFFVYQHFQRFAQAGFNNTQPFWFYLPVLVGLTLPWSLWGGGLLRRTFWQHGDSDGLRRLMAIWIAVIVIFFSLPSSKLIGYIVPALPPLAILLAEVVVNAWNAWRMPRQRKWIRVSLATAVALCAVGIVVAVYHPRGGSGPLARRLQAELRATDTLVTLHAFPFDLGIYSRARSLTWVVDDWRNPSIPLRDTWRKELYDAANFAANVGRQVLISEAEFNQRLCVAPEGARFWVWGELPDRDAYVALRGLAPRWTTEKRMVWLIEVNAAVRAQVCGERPIIG